MTHLARLGFAAVALSSATTAGAVSRSTRQARDVPSPIPVRSDSAAVFEGRTPCGVIATTFTGFPSQNCEKIKWRLTLFRHAGTGAPTTYRYQGTRTSHQGRWRVASGPAAQASRTVYQLTPNEVGPALSLLSVEDRVLLLLDSDGRVLVGDASWSYALNRVDPGAR